MITWKAVDGTEPWLPTHEEAAKLSRWVGGPITVEYWPRSRAEEAWKRHHPGQPFVRKPYSFRAWSNKKARLAVLLVDGLETRESALWLLLHELGHLELNHSKILRWAFKQKKQPGYWTQDAAHEEHPEEQMANRVGTKLMVKLGHPPVQLDRPWWRKRVKAMQQQQHRRAA